MILRSCALNHTLFDQEWLTEEIVEQFTQLAAHLNSMDTTAQLWDGEAVETCFTLQDKCVQLCRAVG